MACKRSGVRLSYAPPLPVKFLKVAEFLMPERYLEGLSGCRYVTVEYTAKKVSSPSGHARFDQIQIGFECAAICHCLMFSLKN